MAMIQAANLAARFLLELCTLAALAYWGFQIGGGPLVKIGLAVGAPLLVALVWGAVVAPNPAAPLPKPASFILGLAILGLAAMSLTTVRHPILAGVFAVIVAINAALMYAWGQ